MDKQKQTFEEMVKELAKDMGIAFQLANTTRFGVIAADLIKIGYRKIPEGAVVLTKEEYIDLLKYLTEKLADRLKVRAIENGQTNPLMGIRVTIKDIDEICKDITEGEK